MDKKMAREWKNDIERVLKSKAREFKTMGYQNVSVADIWHCLEAQVWKGNPEKRLHDITQDIFHLKVSTYMNHVRIGALRTEKDDLASSIHALETNDEA